MRFKAKPPERDQFSTLQPYVKIVINHKQYYNIDTPEKDSEAIRKEGLSNGVVLEDRKRVANFETSPYGEYFMDLRHDA